MTVKCLPVTTARNMPTGCSTFLTGHIRDLRGKFPAGFPAGNPPGREQEVRGDPAGREMLSREYRGEGFNLEGNPAGKFMST
jgi:hypothetical protein